MPDAYPPVRELIPHEPPLVLVDQILGLSAETVRAETTLAAGALDDNSSGVSSAWSLEIVAQACAALIGKEYRDRGYKEGRLIKSPHWTLHTLLLPTDARLEITAELEGASGVGVFLFNGKLCDAKQTLAEGQLTILAK